MSETELVAGELIATIPEGWHVDLHEQTEVVLVFPVAAGPKTHSAKPTASFMGSVLIEIAQGEFDLEALFQDRMERFLKAQPSCAKVLEQDGVIAGVPARVREHTFTGPGRLLYQQRVVYLTYQTTGYILSTTHLAGAQFAPVRRSFDAFLNGVRLPT